MKNYNSIERKISNFLSRYPMIKNISKDTYQRIQYIRNLKKKKILSLHKDARISSAFESFSIPNKKNTYYFGYYDKSPWSNNGKQFLLNSLSEKNEIEMLLLDKEMANSKVLGTSKAWNYQQGSMLQWLDGETAVYNDVYKDKLVMKKISIKTGEINVYDYPIQSLSPKKDYYLSLNYKRLTKLRPEYGYDVNVDNFDDNMNYNEDGIWKIDLKSKISTLIISIDQLLNTNKRIEMNNCEHKVNHAIFSPDGEKFVFMHRWLGTKGKYSRLLVSDINGNFKILLDDDMVSHYHWINNNNIVVWANSSEHGNKYYIIDCSTGQKKILGNNSLDLNGDGHPSVSKDGRWVVTDTYPDKARMRHLILYDLKNNNLINVGSFFAPWKFNKEVRCDLHPRWSHDGKYISIDSAHEGVRRSYIVDVSRILEGKG